MALNVIMESEDPCRSSVRRSKFAHYPARSGGNSSWRIHPKTLVGNSLHAVSDKNRAKDTEPSISYDHDGIVVGIERTHDQHRGRDGESPARSSRCDGRSKKSFETISLTNENAGAAGGGVLEGGGDESVISDLSASVKRMRVPVRASSARKGADNFDGCNIEVDSKKTESTFLESVMDTICNFCGNVDNTAAASKVAPLRTKEERKRDADDTFLGKIISCHPACHIIDVDDFGCGGYGRV